jgi:hypothetical protein
MVEERDWLGEACDRDRLLGRAVHVLSAIAQGRIEDARAYAAANLFWLEHNAKPKQQNPALDGEVELFGFGMPKDDC